VVEIDQHAEQELKDRLTRRIIALELGDVDVPPPPGEGPAPETRTLFVRVLGGDDDTLRVELWEHGEFHGARRVTSKPGTSQYLRARRIALAAAELARRARRRRLAAARRYERDKEREARLAAAARAAAQPPRLALRAGLQAAAVGPGDLWLAGPALAGRLRFRSGVGVELSVAMLGGGAPELDDSPGARWLEVGVSPDVALALSADYALSLGATVSAASVHLNDVAAVDDIAGQRDSWSARAGARLQLGVRMSRLAELQAGPELGVVLRPVPVSDRFGERHRLGGLWAGASIGVVLGRGSSDGPGVR